MPVFVSVLCHFLFVRVAESLPAEFILLHRREAGELSSAGRHCRLLCVGNCHSEYESERQFVGVVIVHLVVFNSPSPGIPLSTLINKG